MKKINFFDGLVLFFIVILILTACVNIFYREDSDTGGWIIITADTDDWVTLTEDSHCMIDGRYPAELSAYSDGTVTLKVRGSIEEAGYLLCGAKYISLCQPIKFVYNAKEIEGLIATISLEHDGIPLTKYYEPER